MSNSFISTLDVAASQVYVYIGTPLIIAGVLGGLLNILVFLSLKIYRQSSTAFYLIIVSFVNIGQLLTGLLSRVLINALGIDWTETSLVFCKLIYTTFQACATISTTCLCLVTIDQFLLTSTRPQWQQRSSIKTAHHLSFICIIFWLLYAIPYLIYYTPTVSLTSGLTSCMIINPVYFQYYNDVHIPIVMFVIPLSTTVIFGLLAYYNVRQLSHRTIPVVRRRHEVQLTVMVLVQVIINAFATTPVFVARILAAHTTLMNDPVSGAQMRFAIALTNCIYFSYYAIPFYIYICVSERFRKQLCYVMIDVHLNRWRTPRTNRVAPETQVTLRNEVQAVAVVESIELY